MKAKANYPAGPVTAFSGLEFVKYEWRDVPVGFETQAEQHPYLEIKQVEPEPEIVPEVVEPAKPKAKPKTTRKRAPRKRVVKKDVTK